MADCSERPLNNGIGPSEHRMVKWRHWAHSRHPNETLCARTSPDSFPCARSVVQRVRGAVVPAKPKAARNECPPFGPEHSRGPQKLKWWCLEFMAPVLCGSSQR